MSTRTNRREFLGQALGAAAGLSAGIGASTFGSFAIAGTKSSGRILGANDAIRVAVAGLNGRGEAHVDGYSKLDGVDITYMVDPDSRTFAKRLAQLKTQRPKGAQPKTVADIRTILDDPEVDVVSIATPNHWHALMTIWSAQAGKDVYVEKPCSHNVHEGRIAVETARKHKRVVQHGTQGRSSVEWANLAELIKAERYGKLLVSRALCYKPRGSIGFKPNATPPAEVDFNLWLGPASDQPFHANLVHYNWHWFWDFGNGDIGNQGVHQMDIARWLIPGATLPKTVESLGGRFGYKDQGQTANTQVTLMDFGDTKLIFEVRGLKTDPYLGEKVGNIAEFEAGTVAPTKQGLRFFAKGDTTGKGEPLPASKVAEASLRGPGSSHFGNFIEAVRSRKTDDLNADILEGHFSSALCHLANISYRLGKEEPFRSGSTDKPFGDNAAANETFDRMRQHLSVDNTLKLEGLDYRLGRTLTVNPKAEAFVNDPEADKLLTREYRKPFAVPNTAA